MTTTLLERARTNRISALGTLTPQTNDNIYHIADRKRKLDEYTKTLRFASIRRTDTIVPKGRQFRVA